MKFLRWAHDFPVDLMGAVPGEKNELPRESHRAAARISAVYTLLV